MEPIYDRDGRAIAWRHGSDIYHLNGSHAAVLDGENVYGHGGQHLGLFKNGWFRDHRGSVVAFVDGAFGGPRLPAMSAPPDPPAPSAPPLSAVPSVPPRSAIPLLGWSAASWSEFIRE